MQLLTWRNITETNTHTALQPVVHKTRLAKLNKIRRNIHKETKEDKCRHIHWHISTSRRRHVTSASSSTISWRCLHRWPLPAMAAPTARQINVIWRRQDAGPGVYFVLPQLLQPDVLWHHWRSDEPAAVCSECGCTFGVGRSTVRPHNAGATGAALASGSASGGLQDGHSGLLVSVWYGSTLPGHQLSAGLRWSSSSAAFCQLKNTVSSDGPAAAMKTDALLLQVLSCGTACQFI